MLRPLFRYSERRDAWVLRIVGKRYGPVLSAAPDLRGPGHARSRGWVALIASGIVAIAAVAGFVGARAAAGGNSGTGVGSSLAKPVSAGVLDVSLPAGWQRQPAQAELTLGAAAASGGHLIAVGTARTTDPSLLPTTVLAAVGGSPSGRLVTLRGATFYRYSNLSLRGETGTETVYAVPTADGTVLAVCRTPKPDAGFDSLCQRVVESIRLRSGSLAPGLLPAYASALSAAIGNLDSGQATWRARLRAAHTGRAQAVAAHQLAAAHTQTADAVAALDAGPASSANAALVAALRTEAQDYSALARAAEQLNVSAYNQAGAAIARDDQAVSSALSQLRTLGYRVS